MPSLLDRVLMFLGVKDDPMDFLPQMTPVTSSNVGAVGHDDKGLVVQFKSGGTYRYNGAGPEVLDAMLAAPSKGKFLHQNVKGTYGYEKLSTYREGGRFTHDDRIHDLNTILELMALLKGEKVGDMAIDAYLRQLVGEKSQLQGSIESPIEQGQAKYSAVGDDFIDGPLASVILPLEERFLPYEEDPDILGAHEFGPLAGIVRSPSALDYGLRRLDLDELIDLGSRQPSGALAHLVSPLEARQNSLLDARSRLRAPSMSAHPLVGLSLLTGLYDMEQASLEGNLEDYKDARDQVYTTASIAAGLDALLSGGDAMAQLRTAPARLAAGQGVGDILRAAGKSAVRRPVGSLGLLAGLSLADQLGLLSPGNTSSGI